ncbi:hypothetical protein RRG08_027760 [Elysia crispata]|uniref:Uncharacterized protein n=1 Tax=Elysia crispata TaxID=231223 RepID=A0AAE1DC01_9GAST|nr:hypothetical protein RRG08_027760 [Elysia crispata]
MPASMTKPGVNPAYKWTWDHLGGWDSTDAINLPPHGGMYPFLGPLQSQRSSDHWPSTDTVTVTLVTSVMGLAVMVISLRGLGHPQQDKATDTETGGTGDGERL